MSYTAPDFTEDVQAELTAKGYTVCECDDGFWFTWTHPDGRGDVEVGETYTEELRAWLAALQHWLEATDIPFDSDDDQAWDRNAERLTRKALGDDVNQPINPNATSVDDLFTPTALKGT